MSKDPQSYQYTILWDVIDEHLDEAAFGVEQLERAFSSPTRNLRDLARYPEERLLAHVDGLVVGGRPVLEHLMLALENADPDPDALPRVTAACLALICAGEHPRLRAALSSSVPGLAHAAMRACELASHPELEVWARERASEETSAQTLAALLEYAAATAQPAYPDLLHWLQSEDSAVARAAALAAVSGASAPQVAVVERLLEHADIQVRDAALLAGLTWDSRRAWSACERFALDHTEASPLAMQLYAALGNRGHHNRLTEQLLQPHTRRAALFALGCTGNVTLVPLLLEQLAVKDPLERKLAAQAVAAIIGIDLQSDSFVAPRVSASAASNLPSEEEEASRALPPLEQDDLDADLVPAPEEELPNLCPEAVVRHWHQTQSSFDTSQRYVGGTVFTLLSALEYLDQAPFRRRHPVARELNIRSAGRLCLNTRLLTTTQQAQLQSARKLNPTLRIFDAW